MYQNRITRRSTPIFAAAAVGLFVILGLVWTVAVDLTTGLFLAAIVTIPASVTGWFVLSLVLYHRAKKHGDADLPALTHRLHVATGLFVFLLAMVALLFAFFAMAIGHM